MRRLWMSLLLVPVMAVAVAPDRGLGRSGRAGGSHGAGGPDCARRPHGARRTGPRPAAGDEGAAVKALQRRLAALKYYPGSIDGRFGTNTLEAVWAFEEVQGLPAHDYVTPAMKWALAHPRAPRVLVGHGGANRIEVSLSREVLVLYHNNHVELISHVSTGGHYYYCSPGGGCAVAITPTGNFKTVVFMPGWVQVPLGEMYNPVFFIGTAFAIHGDTDVPLAPVSHGCVRIPMDIAAFFHKLVHIPGEPVYIR